jgi:predicted transposase/invertase (TIGR01784 family)
MALLDQLWKGIIEDLFEEFLLYFYPKWASENVDFSKPFEFYDKELDTIYPDKKGKKFADKLVKIVLKNQEEKWMLIHIEVQGYKDTSFPERMFTYFYRIRDKYQKDIMALAILSDNYWDFHPKAFHYEYNQTKLEYHFDTFKIIKKSDEDLNIPNNVFSIIILAAKKSLQKENTDSVIFAWKRELLLQLAQTNHSVEKVVKILDFLRYVVNFKDKNHVEEFEEEATKILKLREPMGIQEAIIQHFTQVAEDKGKLEGQYEKSIQTAKNCLKEGLSIELIAKITELSIEKVKELAKELK